MSFRAFIPLRFSWSQLFTPAGHKRPPAVIPLCWSNGDFVLYFGLKVWLWFIDHFTLSLTSHSLPKHPTHFLFLTCTRSESRKTDFCRIKKTHFYQTSSIECYGDWNAGRVHLPESVCVRKRGREDKAACKPNSHQNQRKRGSDDDDEDEDHDMMLMKIEVSQWKSIHNTK